MNNGSGQKFGEVEEKFSEERRARGSPRTKFVGVRPRPYRGASRSATQSLLAQTNTYLQVLILSCGLLVNCAGTESGPGGGATVCSA